MLEMRLLCWVAILLSVDGLSVSRRNIFKSAAAATAGVLVGRHDAKAANTVEFCAAGVGEGCEDLSEGNELIKSLQRKSAENREKNLKEARLAYEMKNFPDYFAALTPPQYMVMKADRSGIVLMTGDELTELKNAGKIKVEKPTAFGGKTIDYSQKPVLVMAE